MQCPRCGFPNEATASQCARCGLRFDEAPGGPDASSHQASPASQPPLDGVWREEGLVVEGSVRSEPLPFWLMGGMSNPDGPGQGYAAPEQVETAALPPPSVWSAPPGGAGYPNLPAPFGGTPRPPNSDAVLGRMSSLPPMALPAESRPYAGPFAPPEAVARVVPPALARLADTSSAPALAHQGAHPPVRADSPFAIVPMLAPGTLLKGGRYRLLHQFHGPEAAMPANAEPPLMVASDTELPSGRVLVQELPLNQIRPEDSENARRLVAQRLFAVAQLPGMPKLLDHFTERRRHFLVFEQPSGELLSDRMQRTRGPMDEVTAIGYALHTLDALASLEKVSPPMIHGNLSPTDIVLRPSGQVILVGFSPTLLARMEANPSALPATGVPGYAAPEQARGQANSRSDLYSLCAVLHHMVTGSAPSPRSTGMHPPARRLNPNVSLELEDVLGKGLRPASGQRFQSVGELREALLPLASGRRLTHVPDELLDARLPLAEAALAPVRDARGRLVLPRRRATHEPVFLLGIIIALVLLVGGGTLFALSPHPNFTLGASAEPTATANDVAQLFQSRGIGLSAGEFIFDSARPDNALKQQAARALVAGDLTNALLLFQQASQTDTADAEAAIYAEDVRILRDKSPYVSIAAAVAFSDDAAARAELQGVYLAQHRLNTFDSLPSKVRLRVLVLNSGADPDGATTAANLLLAQIQHGNAQHLAGVIGWPESEQTRGAISALRPSGLAIVSPTATADFLRGNAANFFALSLSDSQQAAALADAATSLFHARHILVLSDRESPASAASASGFQSEIKQFAQQGVVAQHADYLANSGTTFQTELQLALTQGDDLIFLACAEQGCDADAIRLAQSVARVSVPTGGSLKVLTTSYAFTASLLGAGDDDVAHAAQASPAALTSLYVPALADRNVWTWLNIDSALQPTLADDYAAQFGASGEPSGLPGPDATSILSYDATRLLMVATSQGIHTENDVIHYPQPTSIRERLLTFGQGRRFLGVGGAIQFSITGAQTSKALVIDQLVPLGNFVPGSGKPVALTEVFGVVGGPDAFCGGKSCQPS